MPFLEPKNRHTGIRRIGKRREPRIPIELPVRLFGTDSIGKIFAENVTTIDVSREGAKLNGIRANLKIGEIVGVTYKSNKIHCRVKWVGKAGAANEGQLGLVNLTPEKPFWCLNFPAAELDTNFSLGGEDRRQFVRVKCSVSVELHPPGQSNIWTKISDLSVGGCFVEMPSPLKVSTTLDIVLWLGVSKLRLKAEVVHTTPGYGVGFRFVNTSQTERELLEQYLAKFN